MAGEVAGKNLWLFGTDWVFFFRRRDLDKLYPVAGMESRTPRTDDDAVPPRRKPGPRPGVEDWRLHVAAEVIERRLAGKPYPRSPEMLELCQQRWKWEPDIRDMQGLLRDLAAALRV